MGGTLAEYAERGIPVTVVTATRGEAGEIHNRTDAARVRHHLGEIREAEERAACAILGIDDIVFLGYRDSGMMGTGDNANPSAFWNADFMEAVGRLVRVIRARRPDVLTAYDPYGGYGHPDHIQTHRIGTAAFFGAADPGRFPPVDGEEPWQPARLYWTTWSRERIRRVRRRVAQDHGEAEPAVEPEPSSGTLAAHITTRRDVRPWAARRRRPAVPRDPVRRRFVGSHRDRRPAGGVPGRRGLRTGVHDGRRRSRRLRPVRRALTGERLLSGDRLACRR